MMIPRLQHCAALPAHFLPAAFAALLITASIGASPAAGQSFDCRNARHPDEKTICREARLGQLDKDLAAAYDRAGKKLSKKEREEFENNETAFVNARHRCGENLACIEQSYRNRLQELRTLLPDGELDRSERRAGSTKGRDQQKVSTPDREDPNGRAKIESERTEAKETKPAPAEAVPQSSERKSDQTEVKPAAALPPPSAEPRSRHKEQETVKTSSTTPAPPSKEEARAALEGAAIPEKRSRHEKHNRHKDGVSTVSAKPAPASEQEKQPTSPAAAIPEQHVPATGSSTASAQPASPPEKRHSKSKKVATGTSGTPAPSNPPAEPAKPASKPEIKWVNPAPSP